MPSSRLFKCKYYDVRNEYIIIIICIFFFNPDVTDEDSQEMAPVLVNGSPKLPHLPMPSALDHESFDITLHRRENEGFGFVILTSKSKPPYGGENQIFTCFIHKNP